MLDGFVDKIIVVITHYDLCEKKETLTLEIIEKLIGCFGLKNYVFCGKNTYPVDLCFAICKNIASKKKS